MLSVFKNQNEIGLDEAGRGCWWGPVYAGAVIWPLNLTHPFLTDSKKLTEKKRNTLYPWIKKNTIYGIGSASSKEIDQIGILPATILAMNRAITQIQNKIDYKTPNLIIDGINWKNKDFNFPLDSIVKGDSKYYSIAAASVLAKVSRDNYTIDASRSDLYSYYQLEKHKGYGTKLHRELLTLYGPSDQHRFTFKPINIL